MSGFDEDDDWGEGEDDFGEDDGGGWGDGDDGGDGGGWDDCDDFEGGTTMSDSQEFDFATDMKNTVWMAEVEEGPEAPLALYQKAITKGENNSDELDGELHGFVFKALKCSTIILYQLQKYEEMLAQYDKMIQYFTNMTHNECSKAVEDILNLLEKKSEDQKVAEVRGIIYERTVTHLRSMPEKDKMLFSIQMRQALEFVAAGHFPKADSLLKELHLSCTNPDGTDDMKKGSELIDIYALQMRMAGEQADTEVTKELYEKTKNLNADVKNPKSQSIIRECWGKMWGDDGNWEKAYQDFYEAFRTYQEAGMGQNAKQCLTYVIVANMLSGGVQNPFDAREAQVFQTDGDMKPVIDIRKAKEKRDVNAFATALADFNQTWNDPWIKKHMQSMIADFHKTFILQFVKSYRMLKITFLAEALRIEPDKCEWYLGQMILDRKIVGKIDQVGGVLDLSQNTAGGGKKYHAMQVWAGTLGSISRNLPQPQATGGGMGVAGGMGMTYAMF